MLGVRLRSGLQPASILASSGGLGPLMTMNSASSPGGNVMEMKTQDPNINYSADALENEERRRRPGVHAAATAVSLMVLLPAAAHAADLTTIAAPLDSTFLQSTSLIFLS